MTEGMLSTGTTQNNVSTPSFRFQEVTRNLGLAKGPGSWPFPISPSQHPQPTMSPAQQDLNIQMVPICLINGVTPLFTHQSCNLSLPKTDWEDMICGCFQPTPFSLDVPHKQDMTIPWPKSMPDTSAQTALSLGQQVAGDDSSSSGIVSSSSVNV